MTHNIDENGNPAGGTSEGVGYHIEWQNGPLVDAVTGERKAKNGAFVEDLVEAVLDRMQFYQSTKFSCRENALVITKLEEALHWMNHRTAKRIERGVEGTHTA